MNLQVMSVLTFVAGVGLVEGDISRMDLPNIDAGSTQMRALSMSVDLFADWTWIISSIKLSPPSQVLDCECT